MSEEIKKHEEYGQAKYEVLDESSEEAWKYARESLQKVADDLGLTLDVVVLVFAQEIGQEIITKLLLISHGDLEDHHFQLAEYHTKEARRFKESRLEEQRFQHDKKMWTDRWDREWDSERQGFVLKTTSGESFQTIEQVIVRYDPTKGARIIEFLKSLRNK